MIYSYTCDSIEITLPSKLLFFYCWLWQMFSFLGWKDKYRGILLKSPFGLQEPSWLERSERVYKMDCHEISLGRWVKEWTDEAVLSDWDWVMERCARFLPQRVQYEAAKKRVEASGFLLTSKALDQILDSIQSYFVFVSHFSLWKIIITSNFLIIKYLINYFSLIIYY